MSDSLTSRIVVIGDTRVGKTSLISQFVRGSFQPNQKGTIGAVFHTYEKKVDDRTILMQIWDTAGQEKYRSLAPIYYRNSAAGIAVFDVTSRQSLDRLSQWIAEFKRQTDNALVFVVGNKIDLVNDRQITEEEAQEYAKEQGAVACYFTSAQEGTNVSELFEGVFDELIKSGKIIEEKKQEDAGVPQGCC